MSGEKPLHVQVAEAIGWLALEVVGNTMMPGEPDTYAGYPPNGFIIGRKEQVPRYDTAWSATGPLLDKYGLGVEAAVEPGLTGEVAHASTCIGACGEYCALPEMAGTARIREMRMDVHRPVMACADDITAVRAICILIVALAAAGKLP